MSVVDAMSGMNLAAVNGDKCHSYGHFEDECSKSLDVVDKVNVHEKEVLLSTNKVEKAYTAEQPNTYENSAQDESYVTSNSSTKNYDGVETSGNQDEGYDNQENYANDANYENQGYSTGYYNETEGYGENYNGTEGYGENYNGTEGYGENYNAAEGYGENYNAAEGYGGNYNSAESYGGNYNSAESYGGNYNGTEGYGEYYNETEGSGKNYNETEGSGKNYNETEAYSANYNQNYSSENKGTNDGWPDDSQDNYQAQTNSYNQSRSGGYGDDSRPCPRCKQTGHLVRDCPEPDTRKCFKCNESGHTSKYCPSSNGGESSYGNRSGGSDKTCFKCQQPGHFSRDCTNEARPRNDGDDRKCYKCQESGHMARDCTNEDTRQDSRRNGGDRKCYKCQGSGHMARDCTNEETQQGGEGDEGTKPPRATYIPDEIEDDALFEVGIEAGTNFESMQKSSVKVTGGDTKYQKMQMFEDIGLHSQLLKNIKRSNYKNPTLIQQHCIPIIAKQRDMMACAQTGSGKTAAFLLPILDDILKNGEPIDFRPDTPSPHTLIITPTRELANQIYNEARKFATNSFIKCCRMYGGISTGYERSIVSQGFHLLIATPGRLLDNLERRRFDLSSTKCVILDEGDRMLDMGFKDVINKVFQHPSLPGNLQKLMFSATFPEEIQRLARDYLNDYLFVTVGMVGAANSDVKQIVTEVEGSQKRSQLKSFLDDQLADSENSKVLVFVESRRTADFLASFLSTCDIPCSSIHGDRTQQQREEALRDFKRGTVNVLVATSVASRGLDIKGVSQVINFDMPREIDDYVHRIGRTGRVGNRGLAITYFDVTKDVRLAKDLVKILEDSMQEVPSFLKELALTGESVATISSNTGGYRSTDVRTRSGGYNKRDEPVQQPVAQPEQFDDDW